MAKAFGAEVVDIREMGGKVIRCRVRINGPAAGFTVRLVPVSEVRKADGSLTCQSLLF